MNWDNSKQIRIGSILSYLVVILNLIKGIIYTPIVLKSIGQSQYGIYTLCISIIGYFSIFNSGMIAAYIKYSVRSEVKKETKRQDVNGFFLKSILLLTVFCIAIAFLLIHYSEFIFGNKILESEYVLFNRCLIVLIFNVTFTLLNCFFSSVILAKERFLFSKSLNLLQVTLGPIITIPLLIKGCTCIYILIVDSALLFAVLIINIYYVMKVLKTKICFGKISGALKKEIIVFILIIVAQSIMDQFNWQIDKLILAKVKGTLDIAIYSVGASFNEFFMAFSVAISSLFTSKINRLFAENKLNSLNQMFVFVARVLMCIIFWMLSGFVIFGEKFIVLWAGTEYRDSYIIGLLLMIPLAFSLIFGLGQDVARAQNKHYFLVIVNLFISIVNLLISIPLAEKLGAIGSAVGTFLSETVISIFVLPLYYLKVLKLDMKNGYKNVFRYIVAMILPFLYGIFINEYGVIHENWTDVIIHAFIFSILYFGSVWIITVQKEEKKIVINMFKNKFMKG